MAAGSHFVKKKSKLRIDLKWWEMRSKLIFGHPKWPLAAILWKKIKVAYWSEMSRNAIESDFQSPKMAAGSHFVEKNQSCVLIWNGEKCDRKWFSVIQNGRRQPFVKKNKSCVLIWNGEKCDRKWLSVIQKAAGSHFVKKKLRIYLKWSEMRSKVIFGHPKWSPTAILWKQNQSCVLLWNGEKCDQNSFSVIQNGGGGVASQWPACRPFWDIHSICPLGQIHQF